MALWQNIFSEWPHKYKVGLGTGTADIARIAREAKLNEPKFIQEDDFKVIIYRKSASREASMEATMGVKKLVLVLEGEMKRAEIQKTLQLKNDENFSLQYIIPAIESGHIVMKYPESPKHPDQKYKLTKKGEDLKTNLES